jgi:hypothetical protein
MPGLSGRVRLSTVGTNRSAVEGSPFSVPASYNQEQRLLSEHIMGQSSTRYPPSHRYFGFRLDGDLDVSALERALNEVIQRHAALRTSFVNSPEIPQIERTARIRAFAGTRLFAPGLYRQFVTPWAELNLPVVNLLGEEAQESQIQRFVGEDVSTPFDYRKPPLMRARLFRLHLGEHLLVLVTHNLVSDLWSQRVLQLELESLYDAFAEHGTQRLPAPRSQFPEFSRRQMELSQTSHFDEAAEFWRGQWERLETAQISYAELPFARAAQGKPADAIDVERIVFDESSSREIQNFAELLQTTVQVVTFAAFVIWMRSLTGRSAIAALTTFRNRADPRLEEGVGWFANSHIVGVNVSGEQSGQELIEEVRNVMYQSSAYQGIPAPLLWRRLKRVPRVADTNLSFNAIAARGLPERDPQRSRRLVFEPASLPLINSAGVGGLGIFVMDKPQAVTLSVTYSPDRCNAGSIRQALNGLKAIVTGLTREPAESIRHLAERTGD